MNLADTYAALDTGHSADPRFAAVEAFAARTALALLTRIIGLPLAAIHLPPPEISVCFPQGRIPPEAAGVFGRDIGRYRSWRRLVLDTQLLATGSPVDTDPWQSLRRIARLTRGEECARSLYALKQHLPALSPAGVTFERVLRVSKGLTGHRFQAFRRALAVFDMLYEEELARQSGLLPPRMPQLPKTRRGPDVSLPPRLARLAERSGRQQENAARTCWALAVAAGICSEHGDPSPASAFDAAAWSRLCAVDPGQFGVRISPETFAAYRERFAKMLVSAGADDPRRSPVSEAWAALNRAVRQAGFRADALSPIAAPAKAARLRPQDVTPGWIADLLERAMGAGNDQGVRSACYLLDDLRSEQRVAPDLLPPTPTGITRRPRRTAKPKERKQEKPPVERAWSAFFAEARATGVSSCELHPLYAVRALAQRDGLGPSELGRDWMEEQRQAGTRSTASKLIMAARLLDALRYRPSLLPYLPAVPVGPLADRRRSAEEADGHIAAELAALLSEQGAAASTRREASIAVRALAEAARAGGRRPRSLDELLKLDLACFDWGRHRARAACYQKALCRLRRHRFLPWTPAWRQLQASVVAAGVPMRENPVGTLLEAAEGRHPQKLDLAWARAVDRRLRQAGRADLARTFEANLRRLDALHAHPGLLATGLLPERFGPLRA